MRWSVAPALLALALSVVIALADVEVDEEEDVICYKKKSKKGKCKRVLPEGMDASESRPLGICCKKNGDGALGGAAYQLWTTPPGQGACFECPPSRDGGWGSWSPWGFCNRACGEDGFRHRTRFCSKPSPRFDGALCVTASQQLARRERNSEPCNRRACPVDGGWSAWSAFDHCSVTCGRGVELSTRKCDNPVPRHGGEECRGDDIRQQPCTLANACPVMTEWGPWSDYSPCSKPCDQVGSKERHRECNRQTTDKHNLCAGAFKEEHFCLGSCSLEIDCTVSGSGGSGLGAEQDSDDGSGPGDRMRREPNSFAACCRQHRLVFNGQGQCCPGNCHEDDEECGSGKADESSGSDSRRSRRQAASGDGEEDDGSGTAAPVTAAVGKSCRPIKGWAANRGKRDVLTDLLLEAAAEIQLQTKASRQQPSPDHVDEEFQDDDYVLDQSAASSGRA